ncbi:patatin-like phospholipase family protein [Micromonospora sp. NPDC049679]|uniref:patatin-like phospholipase family protein n=1 Tax=Micromonospora sp. NPDC049679 TaxID=3155920 RepID=UPI003409FC7F
MARALVLGGGGVTGIAWEIGLLAGLRNVGVDLSTTDLIVGTSAGSVVGALVATAVDLDQAVSFFQAAGGGGEELSLQLDLSLIAQAFGIVSDTALESADARARLGRLALAAPLGEDRVQVDRFAALLPVHDWPAQPRLVITVVDANTGEPAAWDDADGIPLVRAVAASCAVPCVFPPVSINGGRYMDGGVRSVTNADLAAGAKAVVVIAPVVGLFRTSPEAELRELGDVRSILVSPDEAAEEAIGPNVLDASRTAVSLAAGVAQGEAIAARVGAVWGTT